MKHLDTVFGLRQALSAERASARRIGFVPTMGAFHDGHLALIYRARAECDVVVVSIFVNPMQFDRRSDFHSYPRDEERDACLAAEAGVDMLFVPSAEEMYPEGFRTHVEVEDLSELLCGAVRRGHFRGVTTVVTKLFNIVEPDAAYFGEKDYQQLVIIRRMVADLNMDIEIVGVPTVREADGLAMSSRNQLLSPAQREAATVISRALGIAKDMIVSGTTDSGKIIETIRRVIDEEPLVRIEYVNVCSLQSLRDIRQIKQGALIAAAAYVGDVRLIDNVVVEAPAG